MSRKRQGASKSLNTTNSLQYDPHSILDQISVSLQRNNSRRVPKQSSIVATSSKNIPAQEESECTPEELKKFVERVKHRRIKLGITQADVGIALAHLNLEGVGTFSQSTICRFESFTLSHRNMMTLKPILSAWLDEVERNGLKRRETSQNNEKKRKRTSIGVAEKKTLEAYFAKQPRPSLDKIITISEKTGLSKNVVRVWFCNQRQKRKLMKFSSQ